MMDLLFSRYLIGILLLIGFSKKKVHQENYIKYHKKFATIEALIMKERFVEAELKITNLFKEYEVKFVKDYVVAAQVCLLNGNKRKAIDYLILSTKNGVKIECLKKIKLVNQKLTKTDWTIIEEKYAASKKSYLKKIDLDLYQEFHKRYQEEQDAKRKEYYKTTVYANFNRIKEFIDSSHFIGEQDIGIDNQKFAHSISDCAYGNSKIIVTLLHYDYPISEIGEDKLIAAIEMGSLHPREFATIYNFEKNKRSVLYKKSKKEYPELPDYKFNFPFGEKITDLNRVNADREKFGICKYQVDLKRKEISQKYGLQLGLE